MRTSEPIKILGCTGEVAHKHNVLQEKKSLLNRTNTELSH